MILWQGIYAIYVYITIAIVKFNRYACVYFSWKTWVTANWNAKSKVTRSNSNWNRWSTPSLNTWAEEWNANYQWLLRWSASPRYECRGAETLCFSYQDEAWRGVQSPCSGSRSISDGWPPPARIRATSSQYGIIESSNTFGRIRNNLMVKSEIR